MVDRRDLDRQTVRNFNSFEKGAVVNVDDSQKLFKFFTDSSVKMITTTIQKMSNLCSNPKFEKAVEDNQGSVIFIIQFSSQSHTYCSRDTLSERTGRHIHTRSFLHTGMSL